MTYQLVFTDQYNRRAARWLRRHPELRNQYLKTLQLLEANPYHPSLRLHALRGTVARRAPPEPPHRTILSSRHSHRQENVMADVVLEHLKAIRSKLDDHGDRLGRIETRLSSIEQTIGSLYALSGSDREAVHSLTRRIERIEQRLELVER